MDDDKEVDERKDATVSHERKGKDSKQKNDDKGKGNEQDTDEGSDGDDEGDMSNPTRDTGQHTAANHSSTAQRQACRGVISRRLR